MLICDSNSTDGTAEYLAGVSAEHPNVRHLPGSYTGRAAARNAGIRAAASPIVLFNDSDILASPDLLSTHLARHRERAQDRRRRMGSASQRFGRLRVQARASAGARAACIPPSRKRLPWLYFLTGNASVPRDDLLAVGCFDESFTGYGHEDLELGYRLERAGLAIVYEPRAVNYHCQDVPHDDQKEKMKLAGRSTVRFYRKHPDFAVKLNLGMTPVSLGLHAVLTRVPVLLGYFDARAKSSKFARDLVQQYYYVSGIKEALREHGQRG